MSYKIPLTIALAILIAAMAYPRFVGSAYIDPLETLDNKGEYLVWVNIKAHEYGVSPVKMKRTMKCENRDFIPDLQSQIVTNGRREPSFGLVQIYLPAHPTVSYEEATDPKFAIEFMAQQFADGHASIWTCYRTIY